MPRQTLITLISVITILIVLVVMVRPLFIGESEYGDNNANLPDGAWYQCTDQASPHSFHLSVKQLNEHFETHYGKPDSQPKCPTCGKMGQAAFQCATCGKMTIRTATTTHCTHCQRAFEK